MRVSTVLGVVMSGGMSVVIFIFGGVCACAVAHSENAIAKAASAAVIGAFICVGPCFLLHGFGFAPRPRLVEPRLPQGCKEEPRFRVGARTRPRRFSRGGQVE